MTVKLETDEQNQKKGFSANYELLANEPSGCGTTDKMQEADKGDKINAKKLTKYIIKYTL